MAADPKKIVRRLEQLKTLRLPHEQIWRDCLDHSFPMRGSGLNGNSLTAQQGMDIKSRIVDSTATDGGRILASALQAGMTPANARWFGLEVAGVSDESVQWLDKAAETLHQEIHNANFDAVGMECQLDMVGAGWFAQYIDVDRERGGLVFEGWPIAQCYVAASKAGSKIDTIYRAYSLTAEQSVAEFGSNVSAITAGRALTDPDEMVEFVHAIYPRTPYAVGAKMAVNMPWASCQVEVQSCNLVRESGYQEMPVIVPRWSLIPDTCYPVGPMFDALPDVRQLNELTRMDIAAADIAIAGMWIAEDDGVLNPRTIKVGARKVIVANSVDSMKPLTSGSNWQLADARIAQLQAAIRKLLMADQLQPQDGPAMTATEIHARVALLRQQLGPLFGRMQAEYLQGVIGRTFMLGFRAGIFGQPPQELANRSFTIKYISPLARAQKLEDVSAIDQFNAGLVELAGLVQIVPSVGQALDIVDFGKQQRAKAAALGVPMDTLHTADEVIQIQQARQQAQQQQAAQAQPQNIQQMAAQAQVDAAGKKAA